MRAVRILCVLFVVGAATTPSAVAVPHLPDPDGLVLSEDGEGDADAQQKAEAFVDGAQKVGLWALDEVLTKLECASNLEPERVPPYLIGYVGRDPVGGGWMPGHVQGAARAMGADCLTEVSGPPYPLETGEPDGEDAPGPGRADGSGFGAPLLGYRTTGRPDKPENVHPQPVHRTQGIGAVPALPFDPHVQPTVVMAAALGTVLASLAFAVLYRRLRNDEVLDNDLRSRMMDTVRDEPGIHTRAIARRLEVDVKTVLYHGRVLRDADLLDIHTGSGRVAYFERGRHDPKAKELHLARRRTSKRAILDLLRRHPGRSMAELARHLDLHRSTVKHHVDDLVDRGLAESRRDGRERRVVLEEETTRLLDEPGRRPSPSTT